MSFEAYAEEELTGHRCLSGTEHRCLQQTNDRCLREVGQCCLQGAFWSAEQVLGNCAMLLCMLDGRDACRICIIRVRGLE